MQAKNWTPSGTTCKGVFQRKQLFLCEAMDILVYPLHLCQGVFCKSLQKESLSRLALPNSNL